jgi:4-alpha-glucanotransferase
MFVGQFEFSADHTPPFHEPPEAVVASLNTHDTATAAGFWYGDDIEDRAELGLLDSAGAAREREGRRFIRQAFMRHLGLRGFDVDPETQFAVLVHWLEHLASSRAACVLINLEDLLQERGPQNVPGTVDQRPNWRRRIRVGFEELCSLPRVVDTLQRANRARKNSRRAEGEL